MYQFCILSPKFCSYRYLFLSWCFTLLFFRLLLQLTTEAHAAETSVPFGFSLKSCKHLMDTAKELGVQVVGATFHIPSSCQDLQQAYTRALSDARCVFDMGVSFGLKPSFD